MYTLNQLEMFKLVADTGSFNKAAESAFVTPNAVMKQINNLESELGVTLFNRTFRGQVLTNAGKRLYKRATTLLNTAQEIVEEVKDAARHDINKIRFGASVMTPLEPFTPLWGEIRKRYPEIKFEVVTFDNVANDKGFVFPTPGGKVDFIFNMYDSFSVQEMDVNAFKLGEVGMYAIMSTHHRLADKEIIELEDLNNETVVYRSNSMQYFEDFAVYAGAHEITYKYKDIPAYTPEVYNDCANSDEIMLGVGGGKAINPFLTKIPINYEIKCPFGMLYAKEPSDTVRHFLSIVKEILDEGIIKLDVK